MDGLVSVHLAGCAFLQHAGPVRFHAAGPIQVLRGGPQGQVPRREENSERNLEGEEEDMERSLWYDDVLPQPGEVPQ